MNNTIKKIAYEKGLKITFLIKKIGLSSSSFYDIVNGKAIPSLLNARKIAFALDSTIDEVFPIGGDFIVNNDNQGSSRKDK